MTIDALERERCNLLQFNWRALNVPTHLVNCKLTRSKRHTMMHLHQRLVLASSSTDIKPLVLFRKPAAVSPPAQKVSHLLRTVFTAWHKIAALRVRLKKGVRILRRVKRSILKAHSFDKWKRMVVQTGLSASSTKKCKSHQQSFESK